MQELSCQPDEGRSTQRPPVWLRHLSGPEACGGGSSLQIIHVVDDLQGCRGTTVLEADLQSKLQVAGIIRLCGHYTERLRRDGAVGGGKLGMVQQVIKLRAELCGDRMFGRTEMDVLGEYRIYVPDSVAADIGQKRPDIAEC